MAWKALSRSEYSSTAAAFGGEIADHSPTLAEKIAVMDKIDREIVRHLQADGRASFTEIGAAVHLSANAAADRVRRLIQDGTIVGIHAVADPAALVTGSFDFSLRVACSDRADLAELTETIRNKAGAQETYSRIILREIRVGTPSSRRGGAKPKARAASLRA